MYRRSFFNILKSVTSVASCAVMYKVRGDTTVGCGFSGCGFGSNAKKQQCPITPTTLFPPAPVFPTPNATTTAPVPVSAAPENGPTPGYGVCKCEDIIRPIDGSILDHEFLIRQATTVNVNAATQLLTVILVAIHDTSERFRQQLSKEIALVEMAMEMGETNTPPEHWDQLVAIRSALGDLNHNLKTLFSYMDYAQKLATVAAEVSYLAGNIGASDAICERIDQATRACLTEKDNNHKMQEESLAVQQKAVIDSPIMESHLRDGPLYIRLSEPPTN